MLGAVVVAIHRVERVTGHRTSESTAVAWGGGRLRVPVGVSALNALAVKPASELGNRVQNHQCQEGAQHRRSFAPHPCSNADGCCQPDASRSRQALDVFVATALDDSSCPKEPNTSDQTLQHTGEVRVRHSGLLRSEHKKGRTKSHQHVGAQAGGLPFLLALEAEDAAQNGGDRSPATVRSSPFAPFLTLMRRRHEFASRRVRRSAVGLRVQRLDGSCLAPWWMVSTCTCLSPTNRYTIRWARRRRRRGQPEVMPTAPAR